MKNDSWGPNLCFSKTVTYNNQQLFTGEDLNQYAWMELLKEKICLSENQDYDGVVFINVAYDRH